VRCLLDAHPDIGCPAETNIAALIAPLWNVWSIIECGREGSADQDLSPAAKQAIGDALLTPMANYCARGGKQYYCDKSLDNVHHLTFIEKLFPESRFLLLSRHVMDTIASGLEASPWGFKAYGYQSYIHASPDNFVAALAKYWLVHVQQALQWEETHKAKCHRIHYEDLVTAPDAVLADMFTFLGVSVDLSVLDGAFTADRTAAGPGDHKVMFTSRIQADSVGRGKTVPVDLIPPNLLEAVNSKLAALGYEPVDKTWNAEPAPSSGAGEGTIWSARLVELMSDIELPPDQKSDHCGVFAIVAVDHDELRWVVDPVAGDVRQGDGNVDSVVTGTAQDLALMVAKEQNLGALMRSGRIRHVTARKNLTREDVTADMIAIMSLLHANEESGVRSESAVGA